MQENIDLAQFMHDNSSTKYRLMALIAHEGESAMQGHYYTYARSLKTDEWEYFDDSNVRLTSLQLHYCSVFLAQVRAVSSQEVFNNDRLRSRVYLLFYMRVVEERATSPYDSSPVYVGACLQANVNMHSCRRASSSPLYSAVATSGSPLASPLVNGTVDSDDENTASPPPAVYSKKHQPTFVKPFSIASQQYVLQQYCTVSVFVYRNTSQTVNGMERPRITLTLKRIDTKNNSYTPAQSRLKLSEWVQPAEVIRKTIDA